MSKHNHECIICHNKYSHCDKCQQINSWKAICCSVECYQKYIKPTIEEIDDFIEKSKKETKDVQTEQKINFQAKKTEHKEIKNNRK